MTLRDEIAELDELLELQAAVERKRDEVSDSLPAQER